MTTQRKRRPWAPHEAEFLRQWYGVLLLADIAQIMGRGIDYLRARVRELGLRCHSDWTPELDEFLTLLFPDHAATDLAEVMGVTAAAVRRRAQILGVRKDPAFLGEHSRRTTLARSPFKPEIAALIERLYPDTDTRQISNQVGISAARIQAYAAKHGWNKSKEFLSAAGRARATPDHPMRKHQFQKGIVPANKGVKGWQSGGRSAETQFKKGQVPSTWKPIGSYRVNADGYLDRKVCDTGDHRRDWRPVHQLVWIGAYGEIPEGHVVRFKEGQKTTDPQLLTVERLECITRAEHARRNAWHANFPPEVKQLMGARIALTRAINRRQRELEQQP